MVNIAPCLIPAGVGGSGTGQGQLVLSAGRRYYTSVRAVTGAGGILESTSDGFVVDDTAPVVVVTAVGATAVKATDSAVLYQKETDSYTAAWRVDDGESGVVDVAFRLGTFPGRKDGIVGMSESRWLICSLVFWNQLRFTIKSSETVATFRKQIETYV